MRWLTFIPFMACMVTLQSVVPPRLELWGVRPDWLLVVVVFLALRTRMFEAILAAWIMGAVADLMTVERMGLLALSYGLAATLTASVREAVFRYRALTQFVVTLCVCLLVQTGWLAYRRVLYDPAEGFVVDLALGVLLGSLYTAAWAPLFHRVLSPLSRLLGLPRPRYTYSGSGRVGLFARRDT